MSAKLKRISDDKLQKQLDEVAKSEELRTSKPTTTQLQEFGITPQKTTKNKKGKTNMNTKKETIKTIVITILITLLVTLPLGALIGWKLHSVVTEKANQQAKEIISLKN